RAHRQRDRGDVPRDGHRELRGPLRRADEPPGERRGRRPPAWLLRVQLRQRLLRRDRAAQPLCAGRQVQTEAADGDRLMTAAPALRPAGALTFRCLSRLLTYPQEDLRAAVPRIARVLDVEGLLGEAAKAGVNRLLTDLATADLLDLQERYVELFDRQRSLSLHLFEHVYADSRDRGPAMVELKRAY